MTLSALLNVIAAGSSANFLGYNYNRRVAGTSWLNLDGSVHRVFPIAVANGTCGRKESPTELTHAQDRAHHTTCHNLAPLHDARMSQTHLDHAFFCHLCSTSCRPIFRALWLYARNFGPGDGDGTIAHWTVAYLRAISYAPSASLL